MLDSLDRLPQIIKIFDISELLLIRAALFALAAAGAYALLKDHV